MDGAWCGSDGFRKPKGQPLKISQDFQKRKAFLLLDQEDERALLRLYEVLGDGLPGFVDAFYRHLMSFDEMRRLLPTEQALERLKRLQVDYFQRLIAGSYDDAYGRDRERVGRAHARIGLPPGWYLGAYSHYLCELVPRVTQLGGLSAREQEAALRALVKVIFLDMGLAIDTYIALRDELIAELRDYGAAFAHLPYATLVLTADLQVVFANPAFGKLVNCRPEFLAGTVLGDCLELDELPVVLRRALTHQNAQGMARVRPVSEQLPVPVAITAHVLPVSGGQSLQRVLLTLEDLREREQLQRDLLHAQEAANIGTWQTLFDGRFHFTRQAGLILGQQERQDMEASALLACLNPADRSQVLRQWFKAIARRQHAFVMCIVRGGDARWVDVRAKFECDARGKPVRGYGTVLDVTERLQAERNMQRMALFDGLTGLANRKNGLDLLEGVMQRAAATGWQVVVLFADLDRFKEINDTQGHAVGDSVLQEAARQLQGLVRPDDVLARLGGDEFMVARLQPPGDGTLSLARDIHAAFASPLQVGDRFFGVGASVGAAVFPLHGQQAGELLKCADLAMYAAKSGRKGYVLYQEQMGLQLQRRIALAKRLEQALADGLLELHYQPKVEVATGKLCGVEALARWYDAEWGWVSPGEFIPVAEERGLIAEVDLWGLGAAARQWRAWKDQGIESPPTIAVNVSAVDISMDDGYAHRALAQVRAYEVPPSAIELEVTETALMYNAERACRTAQKLVEYGFSLAIDDFGTGYSSLARLHSMPLSRLKIDMTFVRHMLEDAGSMAIITGVIGMARALQLRTVAEGVETQEQFDALRVLMCSEIQGYFFSKPVPAEVLAQRWLR